MSFEERVGPIARAAFTDAAARARVRSLLGIHVGNEVQLSLFGTRKWN